MRWTLLCLYILVSTAYALEKSSLTSNCESKKLVLVYPKSKPTHSNDKKEKFPRKLSSKKKDDAFVVYSVTGDELVAEESRRRSTSVQEPKASNIENMEIKEQSKRLPFMAESTTDNSNANVPSGKRNRPLLGYFSTRKMSNKTRIALRKPQRKPNDDNPDLTSAVVRRNNLFSAPKIRSDYFTRLAGKKMPEDDTVNVMSDSPLNILANRRVPVTSDKPQIEVKSEMEPQKKSRMLLRRN